MPRYHFLLRANEGETDCGPVELPDAEAAFYQAFRSARDALAGDVILCEPRMDVEDDDRNAIWSISIEDLALHA